MKLISSDEKDSGLHFTRKHFFKLFDQAVAICIDRFVLSFRLALQVFCDMHLQKFPADKQKCKIIVESCKLSSVMYIMCMCRTFKTSSQLQITERKKLKRVLVSKRKTAPLPLIVFPFDKLLKKT